MNVIGMRAIEDLVVSDDVEFCNQGTGEYFRAIGVIDEEGKIMVQLEPID